jgi:hypothetical protein
LEPAATKAPKRKWPTPYRRLSLGPRELSFLVERYAGGVLVAQLERNRGRQLGGVAAHRLAIVARTCGTRKRCKASRCGILNRAANALAISDSPPSTPVIIATASLAKARPMSSARQRVPAASASSRGSVRALQLFEALALYAVRNILDHRGRWRVGAIGPCGLQRRGGYCEVR